MVSTRKLLDDASARRRTWPLSRVVAPVPGDTVTWGGGRFAGRFVKVGRDGHAELICDADGRRWRLPLADLRRAR